MNWEPWTGCSYYSEGCKYCYDIVNIGLHFFLKNVRPYAASCNES